MRKMCFVGVPAPLAGLGMGQVAVADELVERWDGPQLLATGLRVGTEQRLGKRRAARASCLLDGEDARRAQLELTLPAISVEIALVEGLAARRPDFEQEPFLARVEEVDLHASSRTSRCPDELRRKWSRGHGEARAYGTKST